MQQICLEYASSHNQSLPYTYLLSLKQTTTSTFLHQARGKIFVSLLSSQRDIRVPRYSTCNSYLYFNRFLLQLFSCCLNNFFYVCTIKIFSLICVMFRVLISTLIVSHIDFLSGDLCAGWLVMLAVVVFWLIFVDGCFRCIVIWLGDFVLWLFQTFSVLKIVSCLLLICTCLHANFVAFLGCICIDIFKRLLQCLWVVYVL